METMSRIQELRALPLALWARQHPRNSINFWLSHLKRDIDWSLCVGDSLIGGLHSHVTEMIQEDCENVQPKEKWFSQAHVHHLNVIKSLDWPGATTKDEWAGECKLEDKTFLFIKRKKFLNNNNKNIPIGGRKTFPQVESSEKGVRGVRKPRPGRH